MDFDLGNLEAVSIVGQPKNTARQIGTILKVAETVTTPAPTKFQAGAGSTVLDSLTDGSPTVLNNAVYAESSTVNWAFQWDRTLQPGQTLTISKIKTVIPVDEPPIPEPASLVLIAAGSACLFSGRRRRADRE